MPKPTAKRRNDKSQAKKMPVGGTFVVHHIAETQGDHC
jgi:hypothetical protein